MHLEQTPEAKSWLAQFEVADREVARQLLRKLTLVSESDFESNVQVAIKSVIDRIGNENAALFSITEPPSSFDPEGVRRTAGSSADRVKHLIENVSRIYGDRIRANPTVDCMRLDRIRNIILVEDFIGSGDRIKGFWKEEVSPSVKSWVSLKWTKVWVVACAGLAPGLQAIRHSIPVTEGRIVTVLTQPDSRLRLSEPMQLLAKKYGSRLRGKKWAGYSGGGGTLVFQHGCPNNTPAILWAKNKRFNPLFPNRGIPIGLQECFGVSDPDMGAEILWTFKQYRLALALVGNIRLQKAASQEWQLLIALGLAASYGQWNDDKLRTQLKLSAEKVQQLRFDACRLDMINKQGGQLTLFARDLLDRLKNQEPEKRYGARKPLSRAHELYYPDTCGGLAKN